jgi:hypothetical protein
MAATMVVQDHHAPLAQKILTTFPERESDVLPSFGASFCSSLLELLGVIPSAQTAARTLSWFV